MKRIALLLTLVLVFASPANAWRKLSIHSDAALTESTITDNVPRIVNLYVVDTEFGGALGVIFSTEPTPGFTGVWLGDTSSYVTIGNTQTGLNVGYGACIPPPVLIVTMSYQLFGTSAPCSELRIAPPDGGFRCVIAPDVECTFTESCIQNLEHLRVNCPVSTESTTWGKVKALYRN